MSKTTSDRRNFLRATSAGITSLFLTGPLANTPGLAKEVVATTQDQKPKPINAISVGFYNPRLEPLLEESPAKEQKEEEKKMRPSSQPTETVRVLATEQDLVKANYFSRGLSQAVKEIPAQGVLANMRAAEETGQYARATRKNLGFTIKNNIRNASYFEKGDPAFIQRKARVDLNGMFVTKDNWQKNDQGSLIVRVGFDKFKNEATCQEITSATVGGNFTVAVVNSIVPAFSGDQIIVEECGVKGGLKLSFNLVDVFDPTDRNLAGKILAAVNRISDFHATGKIINAFLPYVTAASTILDVFGIDVLNTSENDKQLWSFTQEIILETGDRPLRHKLLPGFYFIGGFSQFEMKNGSPDGLPNWKNYVVNGMEGPGGNPFLLYRLDKDGKTPLLVDFSYLVLGVSYA